MSESKELECPTCHRVFKTKSGLTGHLRLSSCKGTTLEPSSDVPELALAEVLESLGDAFDQLQSKLDSFTSEVKALQGQLGNVDGRLDGFQSSMLDRISTAEQARGEAEAKVKAVHQTLDDWESLRQHYRLRVLWDHADQCESCALDKQDIIKEIRDKVEAERVIEGIHVPAPPEAKAETKETVPEVVEKAVTVVEEVPGKVEAVAEAPSEAEAARQTHFRVTQEPSLTAFLSKDYEKLPKDIPEPQVGSETEDSAIAKAWEKAGWKVEAASAAASPTPPAPESKTEEKPPEPEEKAKKKPAKGIIEKIGTGESLF